MNMNANLTPLVNGIQPELCRVAVGLASYIHNKVNKVSGPHSLFALGREVQSEVCEYSVAVSDELAPEKLIAIYMYGHDWVFHFIIKYDYIRTMFIGNMQSFEHDLADMRLLHPYKISDNLTDAYYNKNISDFVYDLPNKSTIPLGNNDNVYYDGEIRVVQ